MRLDLTEHWQFTQHPSHFEIENSVMKSILFCPIGSFVGYHPLAFFLYFSGFRGHLPPMMDSFVYTRSDLVMPLNGHLGPKLDCCKKPFLISASNFGYKLLDSWFNVGLFDSTWASMQLDLNEHWQFTPYLSYFETENSDIKIFLHCPKGDPNRWFCRGSAQDYF